MTPSDTLAADPSASDGPPEPQVTFGVAMAATALLPAVAAYVAGPELAGRILLALTPFLLFAALRTSFTTYSVFSPRHR
jgi:hypothetical protein